MKKPILALVPSAYKFKKVYSVLPVNGDGDFVFFRTGNGTRVKQNGLIETISGNNNPRLNWDNNCPSLLCEPQKSNYAIFGNNLNNWQTTVSGGSLTKTANWSVAPNGLEEATRLEISMDAGAGNYALLYQESFAIVGNYSASVYIKSNTSRSQDVVVVARNSVEQSYKIGSEWTRIEVQGSTISGQSAYIDIGLWFDVVPIAQDLDISVWGGQLEAGLSATSYINTPSYQFQTRQKEHTIISELTGETQFNHKEGVAIIDVEPYRLDPTVSQSLLSQIKLQGGVYDQIAFEFKPNNVLEFYVNNGTGTPAVEYDYTHSGGRIKAAIGWLNGRYRLYANGQFITSFNTTQEFNVLEEFKFQLNTGSKEFKGKVYGVQVFDEMMSDAEIKKLTEL
jgi:hypothetical protein